MKHQITKDNKQYIFRIVAPCIDENDLHVDVDKEAISVKLDKHENSEDEVFKSYGLNLFDGDSQTISIEAYHLDWRNASCEYKNGVVTVKIPRKNPALALFGG